MTLDEDKKTARTEAAKRRNAAFAADPGAGEALARRVIDQAEALGIGPGVAVSAYWPMREEMDVRPLMQGLARIDCVVALPVVMGKGKPLVFRRWRPGTVLRPGTFGLSEPDEGEPEVTPRIVFAPLLAFDRLGNRIGWGAGFYDRTLVALRVRGPVAAVGVAYAAQELAEVPAGAHDQPLDWIATEREVTRLRRGGSI
ncbi:MAG: 5-formyltetrahydrofolate cyclo-ligase [Pseudomonadota bacterium]